MAEDEVGETIDEAKEEHAEKAEDPGATTGQAQEPVEEGHAEPDTGGGDAPESDIPVGVDQLTDEQIAKAEEAGPAGGGGDGDDDGGALDVSALMEDDAGDAGDAGDDADADDDADAGEATPDDDTEGPDAASDEG